MSQKVGRNLRLQHTRWSLINCSYLFFSLFHPDFEEHINVAYVSADSIDTAVPNNRPMPKTHSASHLYEDVNDNVKSDALQPESNSNYASVAELNQPSDLQKKRTSRVSFKLDTELDTYASVDNTQVVKDVAKGPFREDSAYAVVSVDGRVSPSDSTPEQSVSGTHVDTDRASSVKEDSETAPLEVRPLDLRTAADVCGIIRGPLGDIYSQVSKSPKIPTANLETGDADKPNLDCANADTADTPDKSVDTDHSSGPTGDTEVQQTPRGGNGSNDRLEENDSDMVDQADAALSKLPDRTDVQKPTRKLKLVPVHNLDSNLDPDVYDEAVSIQSKPSFKSTEL